MPGGRSACAEGGCGWHPSDSLAVISEDVSCRWGIDFNSPVELWQRISHMQSTGYDLHI